MDDFDEIFRKRERIIPVCPSQDKSVVLALKKSDMKTNDWKDRLGVMYSTNPDFQYNTGDTEEEDTLPKEKQALRISLDKRNRGGKMVTLITGFGVLPRI